MQGFKIWSEDAAGILHYTVWTALCANGLGATLQHYATLFKEAQGEVTSAFQLPSNWKVSPSYQY